MEPQGKPTSCSERDAQCRGDLKWTSTVHIRSNDNALLEICAVVIRCTLWVNCQGDLFEHDERARSTAEFLRNVKAQNM